MFVAAFIFLALILSGFAVLLTLALLFSQVALLKRIEVLERSQKIMAGNFLKFIGRTKDEKHNAQTLIIELSETITDLTEEIEALTSVGKGKFIQ